MFSFATLWRCSVLSRLQNCWRFNQPTEPPAQSNIIYEFIQIYCNNEENVCEFLSFIYGLVRSSVLHVFACHTKNELSNVAWHVFYNSSEEKELQMRSAHITLFDHYLMNINRRKEFNLDWRPTHPYWRSFTANSGAYVLKVPSHRFSFWREIFELLNKWLLTTYPRAYF